MNHEPLSFTPIGTSFTRALKQATIITVRGRFDYRVRLADSEDEHEVLLYHDEYGYRGHCDCPGFKHHEGPCAHLWAIKIGEQRGTLSIHAIEHTLNGEPCCPTCGAVSPEVP